VARGPEPASLTRMMAPTSSAIAASSMNQNPMPNSSGPFARIKKAGLTYWADPHKEHPGEINRHWGGRGVYFQDPDGHLLEVITRPYGSESEL